MMKAAIIGTTTLMVEGRIYNGKCLDFTRNYFKELDQPNFDAKKMDGTWFEIYKDKMTFFEFTGICNRNTVKYVGE